MESVILVCEGCGVRIRASDPAKARARTCPRCSTPLARAVDRALGLATVAPTATSTRPSPRRRAIATAAGSVALLMAALATLATREPSPGSAPPRPGPLPTCTVPPPLPPPETAVPATEPLAIPEPDESGELPDLAAAPGPPSADLAIRDPGDHDPATIPRAPEAIRPEPPKADPPVPAEVPAETPRRVLVRDKQGRAVVAREHGMVKERMAVLLPDGQIGWPDGLVFTDKPFVAATLDELRETLHGGEFPTFRVVQTAHYLVFYQSTENFAQASADLLERLHGGLTGALRKHGLPVAPPEFPLVAVIFRTEDDFRSSRRVAPDVQAYYEILSNRVYFYEKSRRDQETPEVSALRKPQTVAHEGTHQVLHNVGIQPRLSDWPLWLVEGFAEYCSPPKVTRKGTDWAGLGQVNPIHMATIRDLDDPLASQIKGPKAVEIGRDRGTPLVEYLVTRTELTPTDYALSWALAHYLAQNRVDDFVAYIKQMSRLKPFEERTPAQQLAAFREAFGDDLAKLDGKVARYLKGLKQSDALPYFAVMFEQPVGPATIRRQAMVSQSPAMIRQWIDSVTAPEGGQPHWQALPLPTRARAVLTAEQWIMQGR